MKKILILLFLCLLLIGCQKRSNDKVVFINDNEIEYTSSFKVADLIEKVNDYEKDDFTFNDDYSILTLPDDSIVQINVDNKEIYLDTIEFSFIYKSKTYYKKITIKDTTAPIIHCKDIYEVEKGNEYFQLDNLISCTDNYSQPEDIEVFYNGSYDLSKKGRYEIEAIAYDQKKNKSTKKIIVDVKEDEVKEDYQEQNQSTNNQKSSTQENKSKQKESDKTDNKNKTNGSKKNSTKKSHYKPVSKTFRIETYGTFDKCLNECQNYINSCIEKGYEGIAQAQPIQENGIYVGYIAVFN